MAVGKVKWFNDEKGWVSSSRTPARTSSCITRKLAGKVAAACSEDETVEFELKEGPKGLQAVNVLRLQASLAAG